VLFQINDAPEVEPTVATVVQAAEPVLCEAVWALTTVIENNKTVRLIENLRVV